MRHAATPPRPGHRPDAGTLAELSAACGLPLHAFREEHVAERVDRALAADGVDGIAALAATLRRDARARERFRRSVAVSHSGFFRDADQFDALEQRILPGMIERVRALRAWSAGCANGLELWSLAVVLSRLGALDTAHLLGSDLLDENLEVARAGVYDVVEITPALRRRVRWERRDLTSDPPPGGRFDVVLCRNVAIYLAPAAKAHVYGVLAGSLAPGGVVVLGRSERLSDPARLGLRRCEPHIYERPL